MRKINWYSTLLFFCLLLIPATAFASEVLTVEEGTWEPLHEAGKNGRELDVVNGDYTLEGLTDHYETYYEVPVQGAGEDSELQLMMTYSDLLQAESSVTISIDDVPVKSVQLDHKDRTANVRIPLEDEQLEAGFHTVSVAFYGHMSENMCANEENQANWLTVHSTSSIYLDVNDEATYTNGLELYPYPFIQDIRNEEIQATVVVPNEPSESVLSAALQVAHVLRVNAGTEESVEIVFEDDVKTMGTHIIAIGEADAWEGEIASLIDQASLDIPKDEVLFSTHRLDDGEQERALLLMIAEESDRFTSHVRLLTDDDLYDQLTGDTISIDTVPPVEPTILNRSVLFEDIGISSTTLSGIRQMSQTYFHPVQERMAYGDQAVMHLRLKVAETLRDSNEETREKAELVVMINDVPHSIAIDDLEKVDDTSFYEIDVPIDPATYRASAYMSIQFIGHGLRDRAICAPADDDRWIYIDDSSVFTLPEQTAEQKIDFSAWPYPFLDGSEAGVTKVIIPDQLTNEDITSLRHLTYGLQPTGRLEGVELIATSDATREDVEDGHVIFFGAVPDHPLLEEKIDELLIKPTEDGSLDVAAHQFINETASSVGWVQASPWNEAYMTAIFAPVQVSEDVTMSEAIFDYIDTTEQHPYIVLETSHGEIFSQEKDAEHVEPSANPTDIRENGQVNGWYITGFVAIIVISLLAIVYLYVKRKKE